MILTEEPKYWFYPDIKKNLSLPEAERLAVEIIRPTGFMTKDLKSVVATREFYKDDQPLDDEGNVRTVKKFKKISTEIKVNGEYILRSCVGKIKNLQVERNGKTVEIANGMDLAECRAYGVDEIVTAICNEVIADEVTDSKKKTLE